MIQGGICLKVTISNLANAAVYKKEKFAHNKKGYLAVTMLGGALVGVGMVLLITIGGLLEPAGVAGVKILQGMTFGVALSIVILGGADLYTGNNLVMTVGTFERKTTWGDLSRIWCASWVGNFLGSILFGYLYFVAGLAVGDIAEYIIKITKSKTAPTFIELVARGILCNFLVCFAVWCAYKVKSEAAKVLLIFCCIFPFITSGFEHSVANMTLFSLATFVMQDTAPYMPMLKNLVAVSIGNAIGGGLLVGYAFWLIQKR